MRIPIELLRKVHRNIGDIIVRFKPPLNTTRTYLFLKRREKKIEMSKAITLNGMGVFSAIINSEYSVSNQFR